MESKLEKLTLPESIVYPEQCLNILLVEDNPGDVLILTELIRESGLNFNMSHATNLRETFSLSSEKEFDVILLDLGLPESTGIETLKKIQVFRLKSPIVVMTGLDDEDIALASLREGVQDYLVKSRLTPDTVLRSIKYGIERKKIQDLQARHTHQFTVLSSATGSISRCETIPSIFNTVCNNIKLLLDRANVISIEIDNNETLHLTCIEWLNPWREPIKNLTDIDLENPFLPFDRQKTELFNFFSDGYVHLLKNGVYDLFSGYVSKTKASELEKMIGINYTYIIGFMKEMNKYGSAIIFSNKLIDNDDINIIETIVSHGSLNIHRRFIEQELKLSETRFKELNKYLEQTVRERTKELESANHNLFLELTERNLAEEALKKNEVILKELNATKDKFFNIIAHDLKIPFTSLIGASEILSANIRNMNQETIVRLAFILNDSAKCGYSMLQNVLDWSRSQTGLLRINNERFCLNELIDENILNIQLLATNKNIELFMEIEEDIFIFADKCMMNTILRNLLSNAIKFTPKYGKVSVAARAGSEEVIISIKDSGIGISEEDCAKLFRIDVKYSNPGTENEQGTGLGLMLCKEFVEKQGGKIWVESVPDKGSEFYFSIPVKKE